MKKVLVLVENYPDNEGKIGSYFVHTRNLYYKKNGINITVLDLSNTKQYIKDGITVLTYDDYKENRRSWDILIIHAANIRHHYLFLKKYGNDFSHFIFFYHGHEVMKIYGDYPQPYAYIHINPLIKHSQNIYDSIKLKIWAKYLPTIAKKTEFVFVSKWMQNIFFKNTRIDCGLLINKCHIIYNCVGETFKEGRYDETTPKKYDFITIRSNIDGSKYCIDVVNQLAYNTPNKKFLIVGKGEYFEHYAIAPNVDFINQNLDHKKIVEYLNTAKFALMPTRVDAQGLMMCEMAAFGIPVITSDIEVCHEVFDGFSNVYFIENELNGVSLDFVKENQSKCVKDNRYTISNTVSHEIELIKGFGEN